MSSNKLVTIIIPTYNTVPEILPSGNAEYLIIDDGSVKEVAETIDKKYGKIKDVKIIHQKNAGVASARNRGIKESKTKYIYFFDADDEYVGEELIVKLAALAEVKNVKAVGGSMLEIRMDGSLFNDWDGFNSGFVFKQEGYIKYNDYQFDYGFYRFVYERQFLIDNNIYFPYQNANRKYCLYMIFSIRFISLNLQCSFMHFYSRNCSGTGHTRYREISRIARPAIRRRVTRRTEPLTREECLSFFRLKMNLRDGAWNPIE